MEVFGMSVWLSEDRLPKLRMGKVVQHQLLTACRQCRQEDGLMDREVEVTPTSLNSTFLLYLWLGNYPICLY
jgi:hypothetical protein